MRFNKRRQPQVMNSVSQPFNPDKFNFTKVKSKEVISYVCLTFAAHNDCKPLTVGLHHAVELICCVQLLVTLCFSVIDVF